MTGPLATRAGTRAALARPRRYLPLLYRVAGINALLLLAAVALTIVVLVPGHESSLKVGEEIAVLGAAVLLEVLLNLFLLRRIVRPIQQLTALARTVDLADPHPRMPEAAPTSEAGELALTFNAMLARLRAERREATGRALAGQEAERLRIARELHDQVGQELTAVLLLRPLVRVPAGMPVTELLRRMQLERRELVLVADDHGSTVGLVTLEDLLEELVGEIEDERGPLPVVNGSVVSASLDGARPHARGGDRG